MFVLFCLFVVLFCFVVSIFDQMHYVDVIFYLSWLLTTSEIGVMPIKLQIAVSLASLIFQKRFR